MPVTAKLSKAFYDQFGDAVTTELVELLNQVDAHSQQSLREMSEQYIARFETRIDQRSAELRQEISELRAELRSEMHVGFANVRADMNHQAVVQMRWMVGMWATTTIAVIGLWFRH